MKLKVFIYCLPLLIIGCSDSTGPGGTSDSEIIANEVVGSEGGNIGSDEVSVSIPAGTLNDDTSIALTTSPEKPFDDNAVSGSYMITGLPQSYGKEITISLAYTGEITGESYIAVGMNTWVTSHSEMATTYSLLPATVDDTHLTAVLPVTELVLGKAALMKEEEYSSLSVTAVTGYEPHVTASGHFKIEYATRWTTLASVEQLGQYLEEAYTTIEGLGFSYAARTNWPISVTVRTMPGNDVYGYSTSSLWGDNYGYLEFNSAKINDLAEIRTTAGHEFFHLVQSFYDPRDFFSKAKREAPHLWLDEACAVWIEEKFSDQQNYISSVREGNNMAPLIGMVAGAGTDADKHGYGLSAVIKYLVDKYGESCVVNTYKSLKMNTHPFAALRQATEEPAVWWEDFLRKYVAGEIYNVSTTEMLGNREGMFQISDDSDTLATFTAQYPDLSGKLYLIRLDDPDIPSGVEMSLSLTGGICELSVFKYRRDPLALEYIGSGQETFTVTDLQSLATGEWHIFVLVSNSRNIDPYTDKNKVDLTVRVNKPIDPGFMYYNLYVDGIGDFQYSFKDSDTHSFGVGARPEGYGTLTGTTFSGTMDGPWEDGTILGNYTITFDAQFQNILHIEVTQRKSVEPGIDPYGFLYNDVTFSANNIPLFEVDQSGRYVYDIRGITVADHIVSLDWEYAYETQDGSSNLYELVNYHRDENSSITVTMWPEDFN